MLEYTRDQIKALSFRYYGGNPVLRPFGVNFVVADPSLLLPEEAPDGKFHMFFHTHFGVYDYVSGDGINFAKSLKIVSQALRPNINRTENGYVLYYERTAPVLKTLFTAFGIGKWDSEIRMKTSKDLINWSESKPAVTEAGGLELYESGRSISNPFYLSDGDTERLYFSCGLTLIKDCGFCEPTYISYAERKAGETEFISSGRPIISPDRDSKYLNLCSGCLKVYKVKDGYIGIQNGLYEENGKSRSAILLLESDNGIDFTFVKPLIEPSFSDDRKWMKQFVYASHLVEHNGKFRIYFNARDTANPIKGRECIGFYEAEI